MSKTVNKATGNRRLLKLAAFLKTVPRKQFDYNRWVGLDWQGAEDLSCGTTACAFGWATTMPFFRRLGLRLVKSKWDGGEVILEDGDHSLDVMDAAERLFGLNEEEIEYVFVPGSWLDDDRGPLATATPKQVAAHIERFVKARA